jgi:hypothetical protein
VFASPDSVVGHAAQRDKRSHVVQLLSGIQHWESKMNGIEIIIAQLEERKAAVERALEALRGFGQTGSITPAKSISARQRSQRQLVAKSQEGATKGN